MKVTKKYTIEASTPIRLCEMEGISKDEWLARRAHGPNHAKNPDNPVPYIDFTLTGSECAAVINAEGVYTTALELFDRKLGKKKAFTPEENEAAKLLGSHEEEEVIAKFERHMIREGYHPTITIDKTLFQCGSYFVDEKGDIVLDENDEIRLAFPEALADIDGIVEFPESDEFAPEYCKCVVEAKTCQNYSDIDDYWKKGYVPPKYEWQCRWYMFVLNINRVWIVCSTGYSEEQTFVLNVDRDFGIERMMVEEFQKFLKCLRTGKQPELGSINQVKLNKYYTELYGELTEAPVDITGVEGALDDIRTLMKLDDAIKMAEENKKDLETRKAEIMNKYLPIMGKGKGLTYDDGKNRCFMTASSGRKQDSCIEEAVDELAPDIKSLGFVFSASRFKSATKARIESLKKVLSKQEKELKKAKTEAEKDALNADMTATNEEIATLEASRKAVLKQGELNGKTSLKWKCSFYDPKEAK